MSFYLLSNMKRCVPCLRNFWVLFVWLIPGLSQAQQEYKVLGTWEGTFTDHHITGEVTGKCRIILNRMNGKLVEGSMETYDLTGGKKGAKTIFQATPDYVEGRLCLLQPFDSKNFNSKNNCTGFYRWEINVAPDEKRLLTGSFQSEDPTCGTGVAIFYLEFKGDVSPTSWSNAGLVSVDVNFVDAAEVSDFQEGYAIIRKGENFAMIDKSGSPVIPFGKYKFNLRHEYGIDYSKCGFSNGMCVVRDPVTEMYGYINIKGELVIPCTLKDAEPFMKDGYGLTLAENKEGKDVRFYFNKAGKKFEVKPPWSIYLNRYANFYFTPTAGGVTTFYNKEGKLLFKTKSKTRDSFGDGMIRVDTTFKMSGDKIGFIDSLGRMKIPYNLKSGKGMSPFSEGLALYEPGVKDEFSYVFINKNGDPEIRVRSTEKFPDVYFNNGHMSKEVLFTKGYVWGTSKGKSIIMDKKGTMNFIADLILAKNSSFISKFKTYETEFDYRANKVNADMFIFEGRMNIELPEKFTPGGLNGGGDVTKMKSVTLSGVGLADLSGNFIVPPVYSKVGFMDEVSGLARATITNKNTDKPLVDGYVDRTGKFVLILKMTEQ
jgi:hypothetical protein